jgi:hypothetical protein
VEIEKGEIFHSVGRKKNSTAREKFIGNFSNANSFAVECGNRTRKRTGGVSFD